MKKIKAKNLEELYRKSPEGEWVEAELTEPVKSVVRTSEGKLIPLSEWLRREKAKAKVEA